jgi:hypothetical protein
VVTRDWGRRELIVIAKVMYSSVLQNEKSFGDMMVIVVQQCE